MDTKECLRSFKEKAKGRQQFVSGGKVVYEWTQTIDEIQIFIKLPRNNLTKHDISIIIQSRRIKVVLTQQPPYLDDETFGLIDPSESTWYIDGDEINIECSKAKKGETWSSCFVGHDSIDPFTQQEIQKNLMLERFQQEHPTFDFSNAEFSGNAPDPRTFMGGISYK